MDGRRPLGDQHTPSDLRRRPPSTVLELVHTEEACRVGPLLRHCTGERHARCRVRPLASSDIEERPELAGCPYLPRLRASLASEEDEEFTGAARAQPLGGPSARPPRQQNQQPQNFTAHRHTRPGAVFVPVSYFPIVQFAAMVARLCEKHRSETSTELQRKCDSV